MLFSIVAPVYNRISFLSDCVDSVLPQHFDDYEVILVDDGSTDGASELCDELAKGDRVNVIHKANGGPSQARNTGMSSALGDYIVFLDADDEFGDSYLVGLARELGENPRDVLLGSLRTDFGGGPGDKDVRLFDAAYANGMDLRGLIRYFFTTADDAPFAAWHNVYSRGSSRAIIFALTRSSCGPRTGTSHSGFLRRSPVGIGAPRPSTKRILLCKLGEGVLTLRLSGGLRTAHGQ